MDLATQFAIKNNPNLYRFLRENSYWYKYLNRSPGYLKEVEEEMKSRYKLRAEDKMEKIIQANYDRIKAEAAALVQEEMKRIGDLKKAEAKP